MRVTHREEVRLGDTPAWVEDLVKCSQRSLSLAEAAGPCTRVLPPEAPTMLSLQQGLAQMGISGVTEAGEEFREKDHPSDPEWKSE
jgi:hypothetical protein